MALLIDVMAGKTSDILAALQDFQKPHGTRSKTSIRVRAYVVGSYFRKPPRKKVVSLETHRKRLELRRKTDKWLKEHHAL